MFLPNTWQLFIPKPGQTSHSWVSPSSYLLRFSSFTRFESPLNMLLSDIYVQRSAACAVQQHKQQPGLLSVQLSLHPSLFPLYPLPSFCLINVLRQTAISQASPVCAYRINSIMSLMKTLLEWDFQCKSQKLESSRLINDRTHLCLVDLSFNCISDIYP